MWNKGIILTYSANFASLYGNPYALKDGKSCAEGQFIHVSTPANFEVIFALFRQEHVLLSAQVDLQEQIREFAYLIMYNKKRSIFPTHWSPVDSTILDLNAS